ncbi:NAD(+) diphosphatase [Solilutibacter silvestris]|uniref:NAD(+) diphosphatase n=1 Tax=Solilutibacter silvestris TaxID=1645665 RepID=A0A2K1Q267_9GAMM|nr:NAD(+) diphosphatase [Lysobacter silvestris]PNS09047.1 NTP pyrophosphohydrolase [Lysobacter silvestris]
MTPALPGHDLPGFAFIAEPLDRADHLRTDTVALAALRARAQCIGVDDDGRAATDAQGNLQVLRAGAAEDAVFLGLRGDVPWFAQRIEQWPDDQSTLDLRAAAMQWPAFDSTLFAQARAVLRWRSQHRHCPVCGGALTFARAGWQGECAACGAVQYPRSDPAVIVAVSDGERLLLGRQSTWMPKTRYSTLAGFVEPGESLEQTVQREVFEESRVRVIRSRYLASQPWPFPGSLMLGFVAHAEPDMPDTHQDELEDARWFTHDEVVCALEGRSGEDGLEVSPKVSISRWLIEQWAAGARA